MEGRSKKLLRRFFNKRLSKAEKKEFLDRAATNQDFVKDFVSELGRRAKEEKPESED